MKKRISDADELMDKWFGHIPRWQHMVGEEELKSRVGQMVYDLREGAGLTHEELAARVDLDPELLRKVEVADHSGPPIEVLFRVCRVLGKSFQVNCSGADPDKPCEVVLLSA